MSIRLGGPLLLIGAGKMGGALLEGWLDQDIDPDLVHIQDPALPSEISDLLTKYGIRQSATATLSEPPAVLVLAVKPQIMDEVLLPLKPLVGRETVVLSIAAGRTIESLARHLGSDKAIVRAMPNTPAAIGRGISVACANKVVTADQRAISRALLEAVGEVAWVEEEAQLDPVTAVSGSGPAYVFLLTECLAEAGIEAGLDEALAWQLARATVAGAGALMYQSSLAPGELRQNVTSPGGTTAAALEVLMADDSGLKALMARAVAAATRRSKELSS